MALQPSSKHKNRTDLSCLSYAYKSDRPVVVLWVTVTFCGRGVKLEQMACS